MEQEEEVFEVVDASDRVIGTAFRGVVHRQGLLHRAVYCWVFNSRGEVLLQRRSPKKRIGGGLWDLSLAEHLQPGEAYDQAAVRGLREELGIVAARADLAGPLQPTHRRELREGEFHDAELVRSYRLEGYRGQVVFDDGEVVDARWVSPEGLEAAVRAAPEKYTSWLREEGAALGWFLEPERESAVCGRDSGGGGSSKPAGASLQPA